MKTTSSRIFASLDGIADLLSLVDCNRQEAPVDATVTSRATAQGVL
jgi:hypothetical protein